MWTKEHTHGEKYLNPIQVMIDKMTYKGDSL